MPDRAGPGAVAPRELILAAAAAGLPRGTPWVAFGDADDDGALPLGEALRPHRERLRAAFVDWLGGLNAANASPAWWAHNTSAKNLLSSRFGNAVLELLALRLLLERDVGPRLGVVGASAAQAEALRRLAAASGGTLRVRGAVARPSGGLPLPLSLVARAARSLAAWALHLRSARSAVNADVHLLTYADAAFRDGGDAFFGPLAAKLAERVPPLTCAHHAWIHGEARVVAPMLARASRFAYAPMLAELHAADFLRALRPAFAAAARLARWPSPPALEGLDLEPLLRASLREDLASGNYYAALLLRPAARRLASRAKPALFLYPYENKALEKMLLLGLREGHPGARIVGYQHTAVTPRHATLLFAPGEAERTPLPDRIATLGGVTRDWLEANGRYPPGLLVEACALRQAPPFALARRSRSAESVRVLFVLSSSLAELARAARWLLEAARLRPHWEFALRPHPEFPLAGLPAPLRSALAQRARDLAGTPLRENLEWCDAVAYASSTAGLEALGAGRPVVNLDFGELLDVDPVLEAVPLHSRAADPVAMVEALERGAALGDEDYARGRDAARAFVDRYLRAPTPALVGRLLEMPRAQVV